MRKKRNGRKKQKLHNIINIYMLKRSETMKEKRRNKKTYVIMAEDKEVCAMWEREKYLHNYKYIYNTEEQKDEFIWFLEQNGFENID